MALNHKGIERHLELQINSVYCRLFAFLPLSIFRKTEAYLHEQKPKKIFLQEQMYFPRSTKSRYAIFPMVKTSLQIL